MSAEILRTERTFVRTIDILDAPFFVDLLNSNPWKEFIGDRGVNSIPQAEKYLKNGFLKSYKENRFGYYIISNREKQDVGIVGFLKKPHLENPDFGFALLPEYFGAGLAFEASKAVLDWGVEIFGFPILDAVTKRENISSIKLLEKLEFEPAGEIEEDGESLLFFRKTFLRT